MISAIQNIFSSNNTMLTGAEIMLSTIEIIFSTPLNTVREAQKEISVAPTTLKVAVYYGEEAESAALIKRAT
jgi:hypothetical protein